MGAVGPGRWSPRRSPERLTGGLTDTVRLACRASRVRVDVPLGLLDALMATSAYLVLLVLRFDGAVPSRYWDRFPRFLMLALSIQLASNWLWGLYGQMWRHASVNEARRVLLAGGSTLCGVVLASRLLDLRLPVSVPVLGTVVATMLIGVLRFQSRLFAFRRGRDERARERRVVIVGAGDGAATIVREMLRNPDAGLAPVAIVDDDPRKRGLSLLGVPVMGTVEELTTAIRRTGASEVLLAVPSADNELVQRAALGAEAAEVPLKVVPATHELLGGTPRIRDVRDLAIEDLLGRKQVTTDLAAVGSLLAGRTVLITGAGGSIGSEISRQVGALGPARLVLLDRDETLLFDVAASLPAEADQVLADVRDRDVIDAVFDNYRPDVVFHAAAHKHVPLLESHPCEAVRTNVVGTENVARAAASVGVERLIFISTDKAVRPCCVMGASKWIGEQLVIHLAPPNGRWCAVRFGNVLGSRGSVIPTFARQIAAGGPVTVTDHRMTRFFMSVTEAVQLVLQAAVFAKGGEVFELEMGEPINILNLAERMIRLSGRAVGTDVPIRITGIRPGEKLVEELRAPGEVANPTPHPSIVRLQPARLPAAALEAGAFKLATLARARRDRELADYLLALTATSTSPAAKLHRRMVLDITQIWDGERSPEWTPLST